MAVSDAQSTKSSIPTGVASVRTETTPLLPKAKSDEPERLWPRSVSYMVLATAFLASVSFAITQVPLIFAVGKMVCEEYYTYNPEPPHGTPEWDQRCKIPVIDASMAQGVALLGAGTTIFGVVNLFITGWTIKVLGMKMTLLVSVFWPALRLLVQIAGVMVGARAGVVILVASQTLTIIGGPSGYLLALNSFATEVVLPLERTAIMGRVAGLSMLGSGLGMLSGGFFSDWYGILVPFQVAFVMFCCSTVFAAFALPSIATSEEVKKKAATSITAFFEPLRMFTPKKWQLVNGTVQKEYGVVLLGIGVYCAITATGYIPTLLQMYSIDVFNFTPTDNSTLVCINFVMRAIFLTFAFPVIISFGRARTKKRQDKARKLRRSRPNQAKQQDAEIVALPIDPRQLVSTALPSGQANATEPDEPVVPSETDDHEENEGEDQSYAFDLQYTRWSIFADGLLTLLASFITERWQIYGVAAILPLAAGTGSASKGTMLQMCAPEEKTDALSAITLVEAIARLTTISLFGFIFSLFVSLGVPRFTFIVNAAVAMIGFTVLFFARFPPPDALRFKPEEEHEEQNVTE